MRWRLLGSIQLSRMTNRTSFTKRYWAFWVMKAQNLCVFCVKATFGDHLSNSMYPCLSRGRGHACSHLSRHPLVTTMFPHRWGVHIHHLKEHPRQSMFTRHRRRDGAGQQNEGFALTMEGSLILVRHSHLRKCQGPSLLMQPCTRDRGVHRDEGFRLAMVMSLIPRSGLSIV